MNDKTDATAEALRLWDDSIVVIRLLMQELQNIAAVDTSTWRDQSYFKAWARNRARHTLRQAEDMMATAINKRNAGR